MFVENFKYKYCPILSISPSEINGLKELPDKDKELILPVFPIKSWATANELSSAIEKVEEAIGKDRKWIADIDYDDIVARPRDKYRNVHRSIEKMINPDNGYRHWCDFISSCPSAIPCLQLMNLSELPTQVSVFNSFGRGIVAILNRSHLESKSLTEILEGVKNVGDLFVIIDLGHITKEQLDRYAQIVQYVKMIKQILPNSLLSISASSFPDSFGGYYKGLFSIYERGLFDKVNYEVPGLIYSDRGGARATRIGGGGGTPPPRIDYATKNEWHFVRMEFEVSARMDAGSEQVQIAKEEKKELYTQIAKEIMSESYWEPGLKLWANYIIELTSLGDDFGINSSQKATAVRINKHLHTQLYYDADSGLEDTDEEWED